MKKLTLVVIGNGMADTDLRMSCAISKIDRIKRIVFAHGAQRHEFIPLEVIA